MKKQEETAKILKTVLDDYFSTDIDEKRLINISRVPLICQSIISIHQNLEGLKEDMKNIKGSFDDGIKDVKDRTDRKYVTKESFSPIQALVYGFTAIILIAVIGAIVGMVIIR